MYVCPLLLLVVVVLQANVAPSHIRANDLLCSEKRDGGSGNFIALHSEINHLAISMLISVLVENRSKRRCWKENAFFSDLNSVFKGLNM